jgi:glycosyltransferase involved in cell wall biosynthesis
LLGVSFGWGYKKGLDIFCALAEALDKDKYQIVLVGTDENADKLLPESVISIHTTNSQKELAQIYSAADLFINPTREDTFPTVNIEALACGLFVLTSDVGGGSEIIDEKSGTTFKNENTQDLEEKVCNIIKERNIKQNACIERSKSFTANKMCERYLSLYLKQSGE